MERRLAPVAALFVVLALGGAVLAAPIPVAGPSAAVGWPVSTLLVSEVQTGGASASDEFAEITNVGASPVDLAGLELVYVTSTGGTVTRKSTWATTTLLGPAQHLFIANTSGIYAGLADATYSGGFAATGGAIVLRPIGGAPIDAVGWGDATNAFVEDVPAAAPAAGSSIERKPGGLAGNTTDTNVNAADWFVQVSPNPQSISAPPVPAPGASPSPSPQTTEAPSAAPSPSPEPTATPAASDPPPTATPTPTSTTDPTEAPTEAPPSASPSSPPPPTPQPPSPAPTPAASPNPSPVPTPTPVAPPSISIISARALPNGTTARVTGVLTTSLGALEAGRKAFVQDETGGIALYLDAAVSDGLPAGTLVTAVGTVDDRFSERTLRVSVADVESLSTALLPIPWPVSSGEVGEGIEGFRATVTGQTVGSPTALSDGLGLMVDDGSGAIRVIVGPEALGALLVPAGTHVIATGPVGQRDSSGTGGAGYRVHVTEIGDFAHVEPPPSPTPAPTATVAPTPTPTAGATPTPGATPTGGPIPSATSFPTPNPSGTPAPSATPSTTPGPTPPPTLSILEARGAPVGTVVTVSGVVTAETGRIGLPPLLAIADGTAGIIVRLPDGVPAPARGATVLVKGQLADPYGQLELRPAESGFRVTGQGSLPTPLDVAASELGEANEGRLAQIMGTVAAAPRKGTSGDITVDLVDAAGVAFRVIADASSGISTADLAKDGTYRLTGIVGQRASRKGALDGYRVFLRDRADIQASATGGAAPSGAPTTITPISMAVGLADGTRVVIEGTVTASTSLLDSSGRRIVVQDATGAIEVLLPAGTTSPTVGTRLRVAGTTGHAWGAPRVSATGVSAIPGSAALTTASLRRPPGERDEWLLVRLSGTVVKVERLGDRWRAEIRLADGTTAPVHGQAGAGIPSTAIVVGRPITVTGIAKRPYPTASDRRFAVLPRSGSDVAIGPAEGTGQEGSAGSVIAPRASTGPAAADITPDTDLAVLLERIGQRVRVGGLIARLGEDGFDLDDGTALAHVELRGEMAELLPLLREGEAVAVTGVVEARAGAAIIVVDGTGVIVRVGSLGQALPIGGVGGTGDPEPNPDEAGGALAADSIGIGGGPLPSSILALAGVSAMSVLASIVRRRLVRRRLRAALVERLAGLRPADRTG